MTLHQGISFGAAQSVASGFPTELTILNVIEPSKYGTGGEYTLPADIEDGDLLICCNFLYVYAAGHTFGLTGGFTNVHTYSRGGSNNYGAEFLARIVSGDTPGAVVTKAGTTQILSGSFMVHIRGTAAITAFGSVGGGTALASANIGLAVATTKYDANFDSLASPFVGMALALEAGDTSFAGLAFEPSWTDYEATFSSTYQGKRWVGFHNSGTPTDQSIQVNNPGTGDVALHIMAGFTITY